MKITRTELTESLYSQVGLPKKLSAEVIESLLEIIKKTLESGEGVMISGFGKFYVKDKKERRGRNPATGEDITLGSRRVVGFKCSNILREKINGKE